MHTEHICGFRLLPISISRTTPHTGGFFFNSTCGDESFLRSWIVEGTSARARLLNIDTAFFNKRLSGARPVSMETRRAISLYPGLCFGSHSCVLLVRSHTLVYCDTLICFLSVTVAFFFTSLSPMNIYQQTARAALSLFIFICICNRGSYK